MSFESILTCDRRPRNSKAAHDGEEGLSLSVGRDRANSSCASQGAWIPEKPLLSETQFPGRAFLSNRRIGGGLPVLRASRRLGIKRGPGLLRSGPTHGISLATRGLAR